MSDPFSHPVSRCSDCGATEGHFIGCAIMAEEVVERMKKNGVCTRCNLLKPCECDS